MNEATQTGMAIAAMTTAGTIAGLFFGWLTNRDKLRSGEEITLIKAQNTVQAGQIAAQEMKISAITATQAACEQKHATCQEDREKDRKTMELRMAEVEKTLAAKKDKTGDHSPLN